MTASVDKGNGAVVEWDRAMSKCRWLAAAQEDGRNVGTMADVYYNGCTLFGAAFVHLAS